MQSVNENERSKSAQMELGLTGHVGKRFTAHLASARQNLMRPVDSNQPAAFDRRMALLAGLGILLVCTLFFFDAAINLYVRDLDNGLTRFMVAITDILLSQWYMVPAFLVFLIAICARWVVSDGRSHISGWQIACGQAAYVFAAFGGAQIITNIFKFLVGRARPPLFDKHGAFDFTPFSHAHKHVSFPSGHSTSAAVIAVILILRFPRLAPIWIGGALFLAATRSPAQAHYPSDIAAGLLIGTLFALWLARWLGRRAVIFRLEGDRFLPRLLR